ncbi:class I SAM-dependent methyltransferase [candidate division WWE3 bacterium]|jgi:ubiquinone/menaquinone biosynthesis C-methylase UbiE|uniref:Class I SAM-dependent methyltransferase n=1 Tax=candidate division WWE3 bacterium TaxID=2053526 RepID=A0A3A4ZC36_UNCKA|nr:MAG: class I SAM-dependent methyltransferase [candidate division WWE3 bacterium]
MSKYFESYIRIAPFSHSMWRANEANLISAVPIEKPLLDIGCGFGEFGGVFFNTNVEVGIDISQRDLDIAKGKKLFDKLILADATNLPFEDGTFASCISISTLEHIKDSKKVICEAYRVLRDGGKFIFTVPTSDINNHLVGAKLFNKLGLQQLADKYTRMYHKVFMHETIEEKNTWIQWVKDAGFKEITTADTMSAEHVRIFELFLLPAFPSQILRKLTGNRHIINFPLRTELLTKLYKSLNERNEIKMNSSNILIVASR